MDAVKKTERHEMERLHEESSQRSIDPVVRGIVSATWYLRFVDAVEEYFRKRMPREYKDMTQEWFTGIHQSVHRFDSKKGGSRQWCYAIRHNVYVDAMRRAGRESPVEDPESQGPKHRDDEGLSHAEVRVLLETFRKSLDPDHVAVLEALQKDDGSIPGREMADRVGIPYGTWLTRLSTVRREFRGLLNSKPTAEPSGTSSTETPAPTSFSKKGQSR